MRCVEHQSSTIVALTELFSELSQYPQVKSHLNAKNGIMGLHGEMCEPVGFSALVFWNSMLRISSHLLLMIE